MTPAAFRAALELADVGQAEFGDAIGVSWRTVGRWCSGEKVIPGSVWVVLAVMLQHRLSAGDLAAAVDHLAASLAA